jgi:hypothetical protein
MVTRRVCVRSVDVVFFKGVIDAHEGLAQVFAESGGDLLVAAHESRAGELDLLLDELALEVGALGFRPSGVGTKDPL